MALPPGLRGLLGVSDHVHAGRLRVDGRGARPGNALGAVAIFATSQMVGVAVGGSLSGFVAERLHWRASFWILGGAGILFAWPSALF